MAKTVGKGTTLSFGATSIGSGLLIEVTPFSRTIATDDITAIDSDAEERGGSLPSWGALSGRMFWDKADPAQIAMKAAGETTESEVIHTRPDGSTQTATCIVTSFEPSPASRTGRLEVTFELTPTGAVTEAAGS